jgi:hypothetical protein
MIFGIKIMSSVDIRQFSTGSLVNRQCEEQLPVLRIGCLRKAETARPDRSKILKIISGSTGFFSA